MTDRLGCGSKVYKRLGLLCRISLSLTHIRWHFVLWDLICFAATLVTCSLSVALLAFPPSPPSSCWETQGQGGGEVSICKISEVIVTKIAKLRLLQRLAGLTPALICRLIMTLTLTLFITKLCCLQSWGYSLGTTCAVISSAAAAYRLILTMN